MKKLLLMVILTLAVIGIGGNSWSDDEALKEGISYSIMQPDPTTRHEWLDQFAFMEEAYIDERLASSILEAEKNGESASFSLLSRLNYTPSERNQGNCGDCWVWSGTGIMEIDIDVNKSIHDRLSIQLFNSCRSPYACCGGNLSGFASWYSSQKKAIPWSNTNASFKDASKTCSAGSSAVSCSSVSTSPNYPITSISATQISTQGVSQSTAIANIKNVLQQNKGVEFGFQLANDTDWNAFFSFWNNQSESAVWDPDSYCGHTWNDSQGGGHAVLIVGYDDSASTPCWIVLNSWGTASGNRPNGLFRMKMNMNYSCTIYESGYGSWYSRQFSTLNMQWGTTSSYQITSPTPGSVLTSTTPTFQWTAGAAEYWLYIGSSVGASNYYNSGSLGTATSKTVSGLPSNGSTVYVKFWYKATSSGSWASKNYTYTAMSSGGGGFEEYFKGSATNWIKDSGSWSIVGSEWYYSGGTADYYSDSTYNQNYSNLDYSASLWRYGYDGSSNYLIVRASGSVASDGDLSNNYSFNYTRNGYFCVWKRVAGTDTELKAWTYSSAINQGSAWNTLRVKAYGSNLYFYINGYLVWYGSDSSLSSGRVGVGMYRNSTSTGNGFYVDWAKLTIPTSQAIQDAIDEKANLSLDDGLNASENMALLNGDKSGVNF